MKIGFVIPWFGPEIPGGAESLCRATAKRLKAAGAEVEILTTCIQEFASDWNVNFHKSGVEDYAGIPVRRFKVRKRDTSAFDRVNRRLMSDLPMNDEQERTFIREMVRSDELIQYMERHRDEYVYALLPYMFGTTYYGVKACPDRSVLIPCLHDESYAYMKIFGAMSESARGLIFNAKPERDLAVELYSLPPQNCVIAGVGVDTEFQFDGARFKAKHGLDRYVLYAGRKDEGKNVGQLVDYFCRYKRIYGGDLKLVLIGNGTVAVPPEHVGKDVVDFGFVSSQEKYDAYAGAMVLCQPSRVESFSIVMMEAWLAGAPVLVHEECEVTRDHCVSSQGGLWFSSFSDFSGALRFFSDHPELGRKMAENGAEYVRANFAWDRVVAKYLGAFRGWGFAV